MSGGEDTKKTHMYSYRQINDYINTNVIHNIHLPQGLLGTPY